MQKRRRDPGFSIDLSVSIFSAVRSDRVTHAAGELMCGLHYDSGLHPVSAERGGERCRGRGRAAAGGVGHY